MEPPIEPPPAQPPPAQPPPPPPDDAVSHLAVDDSQFLGSIMEERDKLDGGASGAVSVAGTAAAVAPVAEAVAAVEPVKKRRGRPPKNGGALRSGGTPKSAGEGKTGSSRKRKRDEEEEEVVCFICFDGGNLVVCDKRGCPKVYHPTCIHRDEAFFKTRGKWNCGWHICSMCQKNSQLMCYTCTYSSCRRCLKNAKFFRVRGSKGFCDTCFGTIVLIEDNDHEKKVTVDFDDKNSWEYLFKLYWVELKENLSLSIEELKNAKERWDPNVISASKTESTDDSYDAYSDLDASSDGSSGRHNKKGNRGRKRGRKSTKNSTLSSGRPAQKAQKTQETQIINNLAQPKEIEILQVMPFPEGTEWATPDMLEFVGHMRDGNRTYVSQYDVQALVLDYIKRNNLRDPRKKSQIICDPRLLRLFGKPRVGHFEMLKLIEMHFLVKDNTTQGIENDGNNNLNLGQVENGEPGNVMQKSVSDRRRKRQKFPEKHVNVNVEDYAAVDMHNIGLLYLRRGLMEELIDDVEKFKEKVVGAFVRIRIPGVVQKQDMYRLVKVVGTSKAGEKYKVGKKMTDIMLEILNLDKKEIITADAISNQEFSEEECKRLRQSIKCGHMTPLKVGEVQEKARSLQFLRINELLENEKQRLSHLRDRASETGRRKELRECVEKLQILNTPEERERRVNDVPIVHSDPQMNPTFKYEDVHTVETQKPDGGRNRAGSRESGTKRKTREAAKDYFLGSTTTAIHQQTKTNVEEEIGTSYYNNKPVPQFGIPPPETAASSSSEGAGGEKVWHYRDPMGNIQGPFSLLQLAKWSTYFPATLKVWLMIDNEENSLLLTDILPENLKVSAAETKPINHQLTAPGGVSTANVINNNNAANSGSNNAKQYNSGTQTPPENNSPGTDSVVAAAAHDYSGKAGVTTNNSSKSIKEYGSIWSPTKPNSGSSTQQQPRNNLLKEKEREREKAAVVSVSAAPVTTQNSSVPSVIPEKRELKTSSSSPVVTSVPVPVPAANPNSVTDGSKGGGETVIKPKKADKQADQIIASTNPNSDSTALNMGISPTPTPTPTLTPPSNPTMPITTSSISIFTPLTTISASTATTTTIATTLIDNNSPEMEKEKNQQSENEYPSSTPPTSDSPVDAPDESWPEVQVHESAGVEPWVPDPTTTSLDTGTSYPSDCLSPADILLSLSRVADEDLEDGDFLARMEALKKKSRLSDREERERPVVGAHGHGHGMLDLSVPPTIDGAAALRETAADDDDNNNGKAVLEVQKETRSGGEMLFLQTDPMRSNSWDKLGEPLSADWPLPSPTPLATPKSSAMGIDGISTSGHAAESMFISNAHQRAAAVTTTPEPSIVMERTTYMDLNTTLQGSIGSNEMAPSPVNTGVTWRPSNHATAVSANSAISWNMGAAAAVDTNHTTTQASVNTGVTWSSTAMHGNMSVNNPSEVRSAQANTGVTWSTLSGSVTSPPAPAQPKPKPYNSWAEFHANSNNMGGWGANIHANSNSNSNSNIRSGWGASASAPTPTPTVHGHHVNHVNPNSASIPEPRKEVGTDPNASWGTTLALGNNNTQSHWDTGGGGGGGVDWASQWNRSSWHGGGGAHQSRQQQPPQQQQPSRNYQAYQRGICKFYESGHCKKGASCNYMHP